MKRIALLFATVFSLVALCITPLTGCATFQDNAAKVLVTTADTVDAAMRGWAAYVVANAVPEEKQAPVRATYSQYQVAMEAARQAYSAAVQSKDQSGWAQAESALTAAAGNLTLLVAQFQGKAN